jgi:hypothetical protein
LNHPTRRFINSGYEGSSAPDGNGYTKIYSTQFAFTALKADGSITAWGHGVYGVPAGQIELNKS